VKQARCSLGLGDTYFPIMNVPAVPHPDGIRFLPPQSRAFVVSNYVDLVWTILGECDGHTPLDSVKEAVCRQLPDANAGVITAVIEHLRRAGVLADIREAWRLFHQLTCQPVRYRGRPWEPGENCLTTESQLAGENTRPFKPEGFDSEQLRTILASTWRPAADTGPSAPRPGPLKICVIVVADQAGFGRGCYEYDPGDQRLLRTRDIDDQQLRYALNSDSLLGGAPVIVVIAIHLARCASASTSRDYRTALIQAGRAAQSIVSAAEAVGLSAAERTEFLDEVLAAELGLTAAQGAARAFPATAVAIGAPCGGGDHATTGQQLRVLRRALVGKGKPLQKAWLALGLRPEEEPFPFFSAYARAHRPGKERRDITPSATGSSADEALLKAIAEAYERHATGLLRVELSASAGTFTRRGERWLDPRDLAPLTRAQYASRPDLQPFDARRSWQWVRGRKLTSNAPIWVPVELVFSGLSPRRLGRRPCLHATSSGVAAGLSQEEAAERALLELIERHALMRSWFQRKPPTRIAPSALAYHCQRRIAYWREQHRNFHVLDLSSLGVAVAAVIMVSDSYPCFIAGAAASTGSFDGAAVKALRETELQLASLTMRPKADPIDPKDVRSIPDHARLYLWPDHLARLTWLWVGEEIRTVPAPSANITSLYQKLGVIAVELSPAASPLKVVRALSPSLIPVSFGYGLTHYTHRAAGHVSPDSLQIPHYFA
jgi:ribosomal protein S12 methylthiotransferase accessory factor